MAPSGLILLMVVAALTSGCGSGTATIATPTAVADPPVTERPQPESRARRQGATPTAVADPPVTERPQPESRARRQGATQAGAADILSVADRAGFLRLGASMAGNEGLAISGVGLDRPVERIGRLGTAVAWSTAKVPVAMAVIARGGGVAQQADVYAAITASDNAAALRLWSSLGAGSAAARATEEQLRASGDLRTVVEYRSLRGSAYSPFGQTRWSLSAQVRFTAGMGCSEAGTQVLGLMGDVAADQRWGLGAAGVPARLKGGWGPGSEPGVDGGYVDRQMGVLTLRGRALAVTIASQPADGSHQTATRNLTRIARWLVAHARVGALPAEPAC